MVVIKCSVCGCGYETLDVATEIVLQLLKMHEADHRPTEVVQQPLINAPKLNRPFIDIGIDEEAWLSFVRRWDTFRLGAGITEALAPIQLFQCASEKLGDIMMQSSCSRMS